MIYVFDTSALISLTENNSEALVWMETIPREATLYYHPISMAEIATQTHLEYLVHNKRKSYSQAQIIAKYRHYLFNYLKSDQGWPAEFAGRKFRQFDTATRASAHRRANVYEQLHYEKLQRHYLYQTAGKESRVKVLADMVDHMILSLATFLMHDNAGLRAFVARDMQLLEAAERVRVPTLFAGTGSPRRTGGRWLTDAKR